MLYDFCRAYDDADVARLRELGYDVSKLRRVPQRAVAP